MNLRHPSFWTDDELGHLKRLMAEGLSAGEIATRLGRSRNAVLGKIDRAKGSLGVLARAIRAATAARPAPQAAQKPLRTKQAPVAQRTKPPALPKVAAQLMWVSPPCQDHAPAPLPTAGSIVVVPMPFSRALDDQRCLFYAADPYSPASADMLVCGCKRAPNLRNKPYCADHLVAETERAAA